MAREAIIEFKAEIARFQKKLDSAEAALKDIGGTADQVTGDLDAIGTGGTRALERVETSAERAAGATDRVGRASGRFNQIIFESGDLVQDLQFGLRGASNNIAFMAENLVAASQDAGGFQQTVKGLSAALIGPAGAILALQGLLVIMPKIIRSLTTGAEQAKAFAKAFEEVVTIETNMEDVSISLEEARQLAGELEARIGELDRQDATAFDRAFISSLEGTLDLLGIAPETVGNFQVELEKLDAAARKAKLEAVLKELNGQIETLEAQEQVLKMLSDMGVETEGLQEGAAGAAGAVGDLTDAFDVRTIEGLVSRLTDVGALVRQLIPPMAEGTLAVRGFRSEMQRFREDVEGATGTEVSADFELQGVEGLDAKMQRIQIGLMTLGEAFTLQLGEVGRDAAFAAGRGLSAVSKEIGDVLTGLQSLSQGFQDLGRIGQRVIARLIASFVEATLRALAFKAALSIWNSPGSVDRELSC